jgi:hypothetical protein
MQAWEIYLDDRHIDTVFCNSDCDEWDVRDGLVNHDGYNPNIEIYKTED